MTRPSKCLENLHFQVFSENSRMHDWKKTPLCRWEEATKNLTEFLFPSQPAKTILCPARPPHQRSCVILLSSTFAQVTSTPLPPPSLAWMAASFLMQRHCEIRPLSPLRITYTDDMNHHVSITPRRLVKSLSSRTFLYAFCYVPWHSHVRHWFHHILDDQWVQP